VHNEPEYGITMHISHLAYIYSYPLVKNLILNMFGFLLYAYNLQL